MYKLMEPLEKLGFTRLSLDIMEENKDHKGRSTQLDHAETARIRAVVDEQTRQNFKKSDEDELLDDPRRSINHAEVVAERVNRHQVAIEGAGPDAEVVESTKGGKQSRLDYRFDLLPPYAMIPIAQILFEGARKYGVNNWHNIDNEDNLNHALMHIFAYQCGDTQEGDPIVHARHAATRILFWLDRLEFERQEKCSTSNI